MEVDEADHYCYPRNSIKPELEELRREKISNLVTINRLTSENRNLHMKLSYAEDTIRGLKMSRKKTKEFRPEFTKDEVKQEHFDNLYVIAKKAHEQRSRSVSPKEPSIE